MVFNNNQTNPLPGHITINNTTPPPECTKFLGLFIDNNLSWKSRINHLYKYSRETLVSFTNLKTFPPATFSNTTWYLDEYMMAFSPLKIVPCFFLTESSHPKALLELSTRSLFFSFFFLLTIWPILVNVGIFYIQVIFKRSPWCIFNHVYEKRRLPYISNWTKPLISSIFQELEQFPPPKKKMNK